LDLAKDSNSSAKLAECAWDIADLLKDGTDGICQDHSAFHLQFPGYLGGYSLDVTPSTVQPVQRGLSSVM
jgi:hypothetical protein